MTTAYMPREGSATWKTIQYFATYPDEQLTADDISVKFDVGRNGVHTLMGPAVQAGMLRRQEDLASGELVYSQGTGCEGIRPSRAAAPSRRVVGQSKSEAARPRSAPFWIDTAVVPVEKHRPVPRERGAHIDWNGLFDRMDVGDSFPLPTAGSAAVRRAVQVRQRGGSQLFRVRPDGDGLRVWRTA